MESFNNLLDAEGCSSSESGWTTYIASPMEEDDAECSENDDHEDDKRRVMAICKPVKKNDDGDSDDSLASDASSGTSYRRHTHSKQGSHGTSRSKQDRSHNVNKFDLRKKTNKQEKECVKKGPRK